ncbi:MAG: hypothetical protein U5O16_29770 [Rhodococcus sp. (in: high G+C Gram-positive bacteria)]|uniref:hypothetical protein n=1 Tax=Rhodococcus sp. TaxID=1831 RepID=UPI002AD9A150|nr:hypothetical protein [Rhodococcus sp. (in: high G+C Gram-positive bacteria)]
MRRGTRKASGRPFAERPLGGAQIELVRLLRRNPGLSVAEAAGRLALSDETRARVEVWRDRRSVIVGQALSSLTGEDRTSIEAALAALSRLASALAAAGSEGEVQ